MKEFCSKCGVNPRAKPHFYCRACQTEAMRISRAKTPMDKDSEEYRRSKVRSAMNVLLRRKKIQKGPCEVCDDLETLMLIVDYDRPREGLRWLCKTHHHEERQRIRRDGNPDVKIKRTKSRVKRAITL